MMRTRGSVAGAVAVSVALTLGFSARVDADRQRFSDPPSPRPRAVDISAVTVDNSSRHRDRLIVTTFVDGFHAPGACCVQDTLYVYIDTRRARPGPEWEVFAGQDVFASHAAGWRPSGTSPAACLNLRVKRLHRPSRWVTSLDRQCMRNPGRVRVAVLVTRNAAVDSRDWAKARRTFLGWVSR
jgi:hypothetical protein